MSMQVIDVLITYHQMQATGVLTLTQADTTKELVYKNGQVVAVFSNLRDESLGWLLMQEGVLTEPQYQELLEEMAQSKQFMGELITAKGWLSPMEIFERLNRQAQEKLLNTLALRAFGFTFSEDYPERILELQVPFFRTLLSGVRKHYDIKRFRDEGGFIKDAVLQLTPEGEENIGALKLTGDELRLIRNIDGRTTLNDFIQNSADKRLATSLVFLLERMNLLEEDERGKDEAAERADLAFDEDSADPIQETAATPTPPKSEEALQGPAERPPASPTSKIYAKLLAIDKMNYFDVFGVTQDSPTSQIERQYQALINEYHLGNIDQRYTGNQHTAATQLFNKITTAFVVLKDQARRTEYTKSMAEADVQNKKLLAEISYCKATQLLRHNNLEKALTEIRVAVSTHAEEPDYLITQAQLEMKLDLGANKELRGATLDLLKKAITIRPQYYRPYLEMGYYYKAKKEPDKAASFFNKALDHNADCREAMTELRLIEMRSKGSKSIFSFGKKKS